MFFKDFVSVKRQKIKRGASQTYDTPSFIFLLIFASVIKQKRETVKNYSSYVQQLAWNVMAETEKEETKKL